LFKICFESKESNNTFLIEDEGFKFNSKYSVEVGNIMASFKDSMQLNILKVGNNLSAFQLFYGSIQDKWE